MQDVNAEGFNEVVEQVFTAAGADHCTLLGHYQISKLVFNTLSRTTQLFSGIVVSWNTMLGKMKAQLIEWTPVRDESQDYEMLTDPTSEVVKSFITNPKYEALTKLSAELDGLLHVLSATPAPRPLLWMTKKDRDAFQLRAHDDCHSQQIIVSGMTAKVFDDGLRFRCGAGCVTWKAFW